MTKNQLPSRGPDYGIAKILRGFPNFEDYYQGLSRGIPIALMPYPNATHGRDASASNNYEALSRSLSAQAVGTGPSADSELVDGAFSPNLLQGTPVTFGSNVVFALPRPNESSGGFTYKIIWRIRAAELFALTQAPYHSITRGYRYSDPDVSTTNGWNAATPVFAGKAASRSVLATFEEVIRLTQSPGTDPVAEDLGEQKALDLGITPSAQYAFPKVFATVPPGAITQSPILPFVGGNAETNPTTGKPYVFGEYGQSPLVGAATSGTLTGRLYGTYLRNNVSHVTYTTKAKGDEAIVVVYRSNLSLGTEGTYNFNSGADFLVSALFGRGGYTPPDGESSVLFPSGTPFGVYLIQGFDLPRDDLGAHGRHDRGRFPDVRCAQVDSHVLGPHPAREANGQRLRGEDLRRARCPSPALVGGKGVGDAHDLVRGHNELLGARLEPLQGRRGGLQSDLAEVQRSEPGGAFRGVPVGPDLALDREVKLALDVIPVVDRPGHPVGLLVPERRVAPAGVHEHPPVRFNVGA